MTRAFALRAPRQTPEEDLQKRVATMLRAYLPDSVWWSASLSGVKLSPGIAAKAKAAGMQRGAPDISYVWPDGVTTYTELKAGIGVLTPEQKALAEVLGARMVICRSWADVKAALSVWMAPFGLQWLTERESLRRASTVRRAAVISANMRAAGRPDPHDVRRNPVSEARGLAALRDAGGFGAREVATPKALRPHVVPMGMGR